MNDELQKELKVDNVEVVKIPISKHENLKYMTPERFVKLLKSKDCLEKVNIQEHLHGLSRDDT